MPINVFGVEVGKKKKEEEEKKQKIQPWDFVRVICTKEGREDILPYVKTSVYSQYVINNAFTQPIKIFQRETLEHLDAIKSINCMDIDNIAHFEMLYNTIPKNPGYIKNRFKKMKEIIELEALYWKYGEKQSVIDKYIKIITDEDVQEIVKEYKKYKKMFKK